MARLWGCLPRRKKGGPVLVGKGSRGQRDRAAPRLGCLCPPPEGCSWGLPGGEGATSAAGEIPNSREMTLRRGGAAGTRGCAGAGGASEAEGGPGQAEGAWRGGCGAGWGVPGLELAVGTALRGTTGDGEPEDGLCPLVASGDAWPRLRASIISRKLRANRARSEKATSRVSCSQAPQGLLLLRRW